MSEISRAIKHYSNWVEYDSKHGMDDELANYRRLAYEALREYGYDSRRGQQFCGANGDADVVGLDGIHIECKRTERLNLYDALSQAKSDAKDGELPAVFHRKNNSSWVVVMDFDDWVQMYREWQK